MSKTVLVIEDDRAIRENTAEILELNGYRVLTARNGMEGFHFAFGSEVDIILCDIYMPEMDGLSLFKQLNVHPQTKDIPFIFLTARTEPREIVITMKMGARGYLTKPFTEEQLLEALVQCRP